MLRKVCAASLHAASPLSFSSTLPDRCCSLWRCLCPTAGLPSRGHRHTVAFFLCVFITVTLVDQGSGGTHSAFGLHLHDFLVDSCDEDTRKSISVSLSSKENMELTSRANGNSLICISSKIWSQSAVYFEPAVGVRCWEEGKRFPSVSLSQNPRPDWWLLPLFVLCPRGDGTGATFPKTLCLHVVIGSFPARVCACDVLADGGSSEFSVGGSACRGSLCRLSVTILTPPHSPSRGRWKAAALVFLCDARLPDIQFDP